MSVVQYRAAEPADAPALSDFGARSFVDSYAQVMGCAEIEAYITDNFTPACQSAELSNSNWTTFLALDDGIAGYAQIVAGNVPDCAIDARTPAELKRIYVERRWHGRGVAQALLQLVQQEAQHRGCDTLWLAVWEINDRAISFYSKNGFQIIGRQGFPIGNEVQSDYVMAKPLANELR